MKKCEYCQEAFNSDEELLSHLIQKHRDKIRLRKFENPERGKSRNFERAVHARAHING
jgi:hypothetical protein